MAARHAGEVRLRLSSPDGQKYVPQARTLLGMLKEQLSRGGATTGKLTRTLRDGTVVSVLYDGTQYIATISPTTGEGKCSSFIPDIIGLATAITDPDTHPPPEEPALAFLPVTQHTSIVGWVVPRPAPDGLLDALTSETAVARWPSNARRPPDAEGTPRGLYNKVVDACGEAHDVHKDLVYGNWDWTNGRDTLTCWSGQAYTLYDDEDSPIGTAYVASQRYGSPGVGQNVYLRGRLLYSVAPTRVVNGMALRKVDGVMYLMVVWREIEAFTGGLQRVRIRWPADEPYPKADAPEDVVEFLQKTTVMWCFNASGTEARRIAPSMTSGASIEQVLTDDGVEDLDASELVIEDTYSFGGTSDARYVYLGFTWEFYEAEAPEDNLIAGFPIRMSEGETFDELYDAYLKYGENIATTGSGVTTSKIAVDYIGDEPEYLLSSTSGGNAYTNISDSPTTSYELVESVYELNLPDPPSCPSGPVPFTTQRIYRIHQKLRASRNKSHAYRTATHSFGSTTYEIPGESFSTYSGSTEVSGVLENYEFIYEDFSGIWACNYLDLPEYSLSLTHITQDRRYRLDRNSSESTGVTTQATTLLYADLRHGTFVVRKTVNTGTSTSLNETVLCVDSGGEDLLEENLYQYYTDTSTTTGSSNTQGTEYITVHHRGEVVYESSFVGSSSSTSESSTTAPIGYDPEDTRIQNNRRGNPIIWQYFASIHFLSVPGLPPDAYDYGGNPALGNPDVENWYANSPYAVTCTGSYSPTIAAYINQPSEFNVGYPLFVSTTAVHRQPVVYQPDSYLVEPEDYTFARKLPLYSVQFSVVADSDELFFSMPLPVNGYTEEWVVVNLMPDWVYTATLAPDTYRFYPMTFISPAFNS